MPGARDSRINYPHSESGGEVYTSFLGLSLTKYHKQGGFNDRNLFPHSSGSWNTEIKVSAGLVPPEGWEREPFPLFSPASGSPRHSLAY